MAATVPLHGARRARVLRVRPDGTTEAEDRLAGEEPMEIRAHGPVQEPASVAVTMRTPGHDEELAVGFLLTEGLIAPGDVVRVELGDPGALAHPDNVVTVVLARAFAPPPARAFVASASCGLCGKASLEEVERRCERLAPGPRVARSIVVGLPAAMRAAQPLFEATGGLHAAGLFAPDGALLALREDVGRHNAVDKLAGWAALGGAARRGALLLVSGRVSFEIVQKAAVAGIPVLCAVSAPTDLAVRAAERLGVTLVAFLRGDSFNVYAHPERIDLDA